MKIIPQQRIISVTMRDVKYNHHLLCMSTQRKASAKQVKKGASGYHHTAAVQHHVLLVWALSNLATSLPGLA